MPKQTHPEGAHDNDAVKILVNSTLGDLDNTSQRDVMSLKPIDPKLYPLRPTAAPSRKF